MKLGILIGLAFLGFIGGIIWEMNCSIEHYEEKKIG